MADTRRSDRQLITALTAAYIGLSQVQREFQDVLATMADTEVDGYPTSSIGASAPTAGPPQVFEGRCRERVEWSYDGSVVVCGQVRPCREHDGPVALTPTERAAFAQKPLQARRETEIILRRLASNIGDLQRVTAPYRPKKEEPPRCNAGMGRDGNEEWANPPLPSLTLKCERWADPTCFGMCKDCFDSEQLWRKAKGLEAKERSPDPLAERGVARGARGRFTAA